MRLDHRAVESLIGFVLVFSLISTSVGVVYVFGFDGLQNTRDAEQLSNVESAFDVLAHNVEDIQRRGAPHRATEFKLYRATLGTGEETTFSVTIQNWDADGDDNPDPLVRAVSTDPVVYRTEDSVTNIRYVNGAVVREDRGGAVLLSEPSFIFQSTGGERTAVFPLVQTRGQADTAISGSTTVLVRADAVLSETLADATTPAANTTDSTGDFYRTELTVETSPARAAAWADHLNAELEARPAFVTTDPPCSVSGGTVTCVFETDRLFVSVDRIDVAVAN